MSETIHLKRPIAPLPALTGLRFAAAMMVFVSHFSIPGWPIEYAYIPMSGYIGVTFFFVLSGFILTYNYAAQFEQGIAENLSHFFISRFARIYPLFFACTLYAWITTGRRLPILLYASGLSVWSSDIRVAFALDSPAWSIGVEIFLYACFPFLVRGLGLIGCTRAARPLMVVTVGTVAAMFVIAACFMTTGHDPLPAVNPASAHRWIYRNPAARIFDFVLGICAGLLVLRLRARPREVSAAGTVTTHLSLVAIALLLCMPGVWFSAVSWDAAFAVPFTTLILGVALDQTTIFARIRQSYSGKAWRNFLRVLPYPYPAQVI